MPRLHEEAYMKQT